MKKLFLSILSLGLINSSFSQIPAFPGAEGFGASTTGGRGGQVLFVTNLNCSGAGSLNDALAVPGPKYILFTVSGIIDCGAEIVEGDCYLAGQTSPDGIIIRGLIADDYYNPSAHPNNIIVRHIRSRGIGTHPTPNNATDPLVISGVQNAIFDHCTFSNSDDEAVDISRSSRLSIQNCLLAETVGSHYDLGGMLLNYSAPGNRMDSISIHHNNWNRIGGRMPEFSCEDPTGCIGSTLKFEYACNLLWDQQRVVYHNIDANLTNGSDPGFVEPYFLQGNIVNNLGISRPEYCEAMFQNTFLEMSQNQLYINGNNHNNYSTYTDLDLFNCCNDFCTLGVPNTDFGNATLLSSRHNYPSISYTNTTDLPNYMVSNVGAFPRFPHETRLMNAVATNTFDTAHLSVNAVDDILDLPTFTSIYPSDSDNDGMPDYWETSHGLNPSIADHNGTSLSFGITGINGYTNLECYLNCLSDAIVNGTTPTCGIALSVEEQTNSNQFSFYPNPSNESTIVHLNANQQSHIRILSVSGEVVYEKIIDGIGQTEINTANFSNGIYMIEVNKQIAKLIIQH